MNINIDTTQVERILIALAHYVELINWYQDPNSRPTFQPNQMEIDETVKTAKDLVHILYVKNLEAQS